MSDNTRVTAGPFTLVIPPNGRATLLEADPAGDDHECPWGIGNLEALVQFAGEVLRLQACLKQMCVDRADGDLAVRDAISETARTSDELAFWRYQAVWHRACMLRGEPLAEGLEETNYWRDAERQLEKFRTDENRERYAHAEAPRDPTGT